MVGRRTELERLQQMWRAARGGRSHLALVSGEPGVGKTRLARELTATAQLDGAVVLSGSCYEYEATTPYLPLVEALRRLVRERDDTELAAVLGDSAAEIARLAPEVESRLGPFAARPALSPQEERLRLFDHLARVLERLAGSRGLLLFLDDLQWADHGSLSLLHFLLRQLSDAPILFLGAYREVELDRAHPLSHSLVEWTRERLLTRVRLDRLGHEDTGRMISTLLGGQDVSPEFLAALHLETEGNPFFVEEIVKALVAEGQLVREGTVWSRGPTGELPIPQSVKAAIGSRLERIGEGCVEVLSTAAVLGKRFEFAELAAVASRSEEELLDALDEAARAQLVTAGRGESFAFTHDKIREVLYDELNPIRRRRLHARIAEGLERLQQEGASVSVEDVAHHHVESGHLEQGLVWADRAADAARRVFAWDEALAMLSRARECAEALGRSPEVARIDEAMGDIAHAAGNLAAAGHYERALAATTDADRRHALRCKAADVYVVAGRTEGLDHVRHLLAEVDPERAPHTAARAMMLDARYMHLAGRLPEAAERYRSAVALAETLGDADLLVRLLSFFAGTLQHMARFDESNAVAQRCVEIGKREKLPSGVMLGLEFLSENASFCGRWEDSVRCGEQEETVAREVRAGERNLWSQLRAYSLHQLGRLEEAERLFRRAIGESERAGELRLGLFMRMFFAACLADTGRVQEGLELVRRALQEADHAALVAHRINGRGCLVHCLLRVGALEEALREARLALELWRTSGSKGMALIHGAVLAEALVRGAAASEARQALDDHADLCRLAGATLRLAQNLRVRALLAAREGLAGEARETLDRAVEALATCGSPIELSRALAQRARLLRAAGDAAAAGADLARGRELLEACGATIEILAAAG
jgi:tetratricopeptide (TPR) repeat protein